MVYFNNSAFNPGFNNFSIGANPNVKAKEAANKHHTSNVHKHADKFVSAEAKAYVQQSLAFNSGGRSSAPSSPIGSNPSPIGSGYQYKVMGGSDISSHQQRLAAAYEEQAQLDAQRHQKLLIAAENDRIKAQQQQQVQNQQTQQVQHAPVKDNTLQWVNTGLKAISMLF